MALFVCSCKNKSYAGWFNNKKCKDCGTKIHNPKGVAVGGYQWKTREIKKLKSKLKKANELLNEAVEVINS
jgi:hypothetical protein